MCYSLASNMNMLKTADDDCDVSECGAEAEEGWETVQRTNKTKFRPSPTGGAAAKTSMPARQADGDGKRTVSQLRHKEGNCRANVTVSRHKQQGSLSAIDVNGNTSNFTKSPSLNSTQQSKSSSHIGGSRGVRGAKSSPRPMRLPATVYNTETDKSETCLKTADMPAADAVGETESKLIESNLRGSGDRRLVAGDDDAVESRLQLHRAVYDAVTHEQPSVGSTDVTLSHAVSSRTSSSMTEVHRSESADIQPSSADADKTSFHLCRKSLSDDTLLERMTVSGAPLIIGNALCI